MLTSSDIAIEVIGVDRRNDARAAKLLPSHSLNIIISDVHCLCSKPIINLELRWLSLISVVAVRGEGLRQEELSWYYYGLEQMVSSIIVE